MESAPALDGLGIGDLKLLFDTESRIRRDTCWLYEEDVRRTNFYSMIFSQDFCDDLSNNCYFLERATIFVTQLVIVFFYSSVCFD